MRIAIFGASGFLGNNLARHVLESTNWNVRAVARSRNKLRRIGHPDARLELVTCNVLNKARLTEALKDVDIAYYFIHFMGQSDRDFYEAELEAASTFSKAAKSSRVKRIIYMGGLGDNAKSESKHLHSRHRTGEILRSELPEVIELRASMIIGDGSVAYDIIRNIVHKLPIAPLPGAANTKTQPIALLDALRYLVASATLPIKESLVIDIGGPNVLTYADIYREYAKFVGVRRPVVRLPRVRPKVAGKFLDLLTPSIHARIGAIMAESMSNEMVVANTKAEELFPYIAPMPIQSAFSNANDLPGPHK